ncbi:unnamed protein product [Prunus armeniaca]|uniref:DUF4283 domain-containing protein n=1 Tax=Prunus armeniaca TaxID=36596 RepID=A0A6J5XIT9_PRUAR|nr:unnamed protein product [Prunus armeniaca]
MSRLHSAGTNAWVALVRACNTVGAGLCLMEDMVTDFASRFALTEEEQKEVVVERGSVHKLRTTNFLLIGKLLTRKAVNPEAFMRTMTALWRPKVRVQIGRAGGKLVPFLILDKGGQTADIGWRSMDFQPLPSGFSGGRWSGSPF